MSKSFRKRFVFWLDLHKEDEQCIAQEITTLKEKRSFARTIRDGIRLILDLRKGNTEVLAQLFPHVVEKLQGKKPTGGEDLVDQLARIEQLLNIQKPAPAFSVPTPEPLVLPEVSDTSNADSADGAQKFLNSLSALMNG